MFIPDFQQTALDHLCRYSFPVDLLIWLCRTYCIQHQLYQLFYRPDFDTIPIASVAFIHCYGVSVKALSPDSALNLSNSIGLKLVICLVLNKTFRKCNDKLPSFNTFPSCSASFSVLIDLHIHWADTQTFSTMNTFAFIAVNTQD